MIAIQLANLSNHKGGNQMAYSGEEGQTKK
jgi:hypothetical protein